MNGPYKQLEKEAARRRRASIATPARAVSVRRRATSAAACVATLAVLVGGGIALAASGILNGSSIGPASRSTHARALECPPQEDHGYSRYEQLTPKADYRGECESSALHGASRAYRSAASKTDRLGELGIDGAFRDDERFHPITRNALPQHLHGSGVTATCVSAHPRLQRPDHRPRPQRPPQPHRHPAIHQREISFGLLGPQATGVEYESPSGPQRIRVLKPLGAYLIVRATSGETKPQEIPRRPTGRPYPQETSRASPTASTATPARSASARQPHACPNRVAATPARSRPRAKPRRVPKPDPQAVPSATNPRPA